MNLDSLSRLGKTIKSTTGQQGFRRVALILGALGFAAGLFLAIKNQSNVLQDIRWGLLPWSL